MGDQKERNAPWLSVPQFGDWDQKGPLPDYSMDFSKIREMRKQNKREPSRVSLGNEDEFTSSTTKSTETVHHTDHHGYHRTHSPTRDACCIGHKSVKARSWQGGAFSATSTAV